MHSLSAVLSTVRAQSKNSAIFSFLTSGREINLQQQTAAGHSSGSWSQLRQPATAPAAGHSSGSWSQLRQLVTAPAAGHSSGSWSQSQLSQEHTHFASSRAAASRDLSVTSRYSFPTAMTLSMVECQGPSLGADPSMRHRSNGMITMMESHSNRM